MKKIKAFEIIVLCMFSVLLLSFAVVQEKNQQSIASHSYVASQQTKTIPQPAMQESNLNNPQKTESTFIPAGSWAKPQSILLGVIIVLSLILVGGFVVYNDLSIRP